MPEINAQLQSELDKLIKIANTYREGDIGKSFFLDVVAKYVNSESDYITYGDYLLSNGVKIISDDEIEEEDYGKKEKITIKPYDTKLIDISPLQLSLDTIIARLENNEIDLMPDFQRKAGLWTEVQKSRLIESLILRIPLPAFYFDGSDSDKWIVIDGLQRLTSLKEFFVTKKLKLTGMEFLKDLDGSSKDDMPRAYLRRMNETQTINYIINPGAPTNLKYNIFKRINTGGINLEPQEIRHALYPGLATNFLKRLAQKSQFKESTGYSIKSERMMDQEFVLRFIAFYEFTIEKYIDTIDDFLNDAMDYVNKHYDKVHEAEVERKFELVLDTCYQIFDKFAFRRMPDLEKRRPISKALFETWTATLATYSIDDLQKLVENKKAIRSSYEAMCVNDKEFIDSIGGGKISDARKRFEKIKNLVEGVLHNDKKN